MKLVFEGLEHSLEIDPGCPTVLQVENEALFSRLISSLLSEEGRYAQEAYSLWDGDAELLPKDAFLFVPNVFELPWNHRSLLGEVVKRLERELIDDEDARMELEKVEQVLASHLIALSGGLSADYSLVAEWDLSKSLKMLGFGANPMPGEKLIDNLILFLSFTLDAKCEKILTFINLKTFLTKNELERFYEHVFYTKISVLLLENKHDTETYRYERKQVVDLQFLEY